MITTAPPADGENIRYNSITSLRAVHTKLLKHNSDHENDPAQLDKIEQFVRAAAGTGALLDSDNDRYGVQSLIDYWITVLYRGHRNPPDATLVDFDASLSPKLDDSLCPYRGLNAFQETDNAIFFGRQRLLDVLLKKITTTPVLFVVGPSGSGKSSLVLAALIPALRNNRIPGAASWQYVPSFVPGADPLKNLALALGTLYRQSHEWVVQQIQEMKRDSSHLAKVVASFSSKPAVVVIDQFEEVFTLCLDDTLRAAFIDNLLALATATGANNQVVLTLRTDYETYLAQNPGLMALFEEGQVRVMPLTAAELRSAIEEPARHVNLRFEDGVVDSLVKDILGEPEGLPLLQFTLLRLWKTRENGRNRITLNEYRKLGGARRALALTADEFYESLNEANRITLRRIMLRLALPSGTAEVLRNTVRRESLYFEDPRRVNDVLNELAENGLIRVTKAEDQKNDKIEVAHEALVRHWPTLVSWIEAERVVMRQRLRLTSAAQQWLEHGKDEGGLLGGSLLSEARQYEALNDLEKEFVAASQAAVDNAERQKEQERRQKQVRLRQFVSVLTVLLIVAIGAAIFGLWQAKQARANERRAKEKETLARTNYELAQTNYVESERQKVLAEQQRIEAEKQANIARDSKEQMGIALDKAKQAEALARTESEKAKRETQRAIAAGIEARRYSDLYSGLLKEKEKELEARRQELDLRNKRDEANAYLKRERLNEAISTYETLLEKYKAAKDLKGQAEMHGQLSRAYFLLAEKAEKKQDGLSATKNHQKSVAEYESALKIIESESTKELDAAKGDKDKVFSILWEKAQFFKDHGKAAEAEKTYIDAMTVQESVLTKNDLIREQNYDNLVDNLIELYRGQPQKLIDLQRHVLEVKSKLHPSTEGLEMYRRVRELAGLYREQKSPVEARRRYHEALSILEQVIKAEKTENEPVMLGHLVESLSDLASNYNALGVPADAEQYYRQALAKQQQRVAIEGKGQDELAEVETALAKTLKVQQKYPEALQFFGEAIKHCYGEKSVNPKTLVESLDAISQILRIQGQSEKIEQSYKEVLTAYSGNQNVEKAIAESLISQAVNQYKTAGDKTPREAIKYFGAAERLISLAFSASKDVRFLDTEAFQSAITAIIKQRFTGDGEGDLVDADNFLTELLEMKLQSSSDGDPRRLRSAEQLISTMERRYRNSDEQKLATMYQTALKVRTRLNNGTDNPSVYGNHNDLGKLYLRLEQYDKAKANYRAALEIVERVFKPNSGSLVVDSLINLANVHVTVKEYAEAEELYKRAKLNLETNKLENSLKMVVVLTAYANLLEKTGRDADATKMENEAQRIRSKLGAAGKNDSEK